MDVGEEAPCHLGEVQAIIGTVGGVPFAAGVEIFVAQAVDEVGDYLRLISAVFPGELNAPGCLLRALRVTAVEVSPGDPVSMRCRGEVGAVDFKSGKLLVFVSMDVENGDGASELAWRLHQRRCDCGDGCDGLRMAGGE